MINPYLKEGGFMLELQEKIKSLADKAQVPINLMDVGITLTVAMSKEQLDDLSAMINFLEGSQMLPAEILYNVLHDLTGLKAIHLDDPHGIGFSPRSKGYRNK